MPVSTLWVTLVENQCLLRNNGSLCDNYGTGCCKVFVRELKGEHLGPYYKPSTLASKA